MKHKVTALLLVIFMSGLAACNLDKKYTDSDLQDALQKGQAQEKQKNLDALRIEANTPGGPEGQPGQVVLQGPFTTKLGALIEQIKVKIVGGIDHVGRKTKPSTESLQISELDVEKFNKQKSAVKLFYHQAPLLNYWCGIDLVSAYADLEKLMIDPKSSFVKISDYGDSRVIAKTVFLCNPDRLQGSSNSVIIADTVVLNDFSYDQGFNSINGGLTIIADRLIILGENELVSRPMPNSMAIRNDASLNSQEVGQRLTPVFTIMAKSIEGEGHLTIKSFGSDNFNFRELYEK